MTYLEIAEAILVAACLFMCGYCAGESAGWERAERWFWATREKK